ncbi:Calcium ion binding [Dermatophagoides pteronyssinus]|uniref:Calcium ion binding n=1 Tax=Dermatophagoides pteronyssinus TaxID=6956 RepID=A0ABQ8JB37_DERPT|nr:Calcium ion binding [Dermatophagoides pteronyssinus]
MKILAQKGMEIKKLSLSTLQFYFHHQQQQQQQRKERQKSSSKQQQQQQQQRIKLERRRQNVNLPSTKFAATTTTTPTSSLKKLNETNIDNKIKQNKNKNNKPGTKNNINNNRKNNRNDDDEDATRWKMISSNQINTIHHNEHNNGNQLKPKQSKQQQQQRTNILNKFEHQHHQQQQQGNNNSSQNKSNNNIIQCPSCPFSHGSQVICGTDNSTYSSMCRIEYHNCIHGFDVRFACFGFCPCSKLIQTKMMATTNTAIATITTPSTKSSKLKRKNNFINKIDETHEIHTLKQSTNSTNLLTKHSLKQYHYLIDNDENDSLIKTNHNNQNNNFERMKECSSDELRSMGFRLLDWFAVVMQEELTRIKTNVTNKLLQQQQQQQQRLLNKINNNTYLPDCEESVSFMFYHFDIDNNYKLTSKELYYLVHDENEHCLEPYLIKCDEDHNHLLTIYEWCSCFSLPKPCLYHQKQLIQQNNDKIIGQYLPQCDEKGHYRNIQCQHTTKHCWCSDKNGNEIAGTRVHGRLPVCAV